jgi:cytochrome b561
LGYLTAVTSPNPVPTLFLLLWNVPHPPLNQHFFEGIRPLHQWFAIGLIALAVWHAAPTSYRRR